MPRSRPGCCSLRSRLVHARAYHDITTHNQRRLISHEDRQLWLDSLAAIAFAPNDARDAAEEEEGGLRTTKVITNFYKAFNAEGDVVLVRALMQC